MKIFFLFTILLGSLSLWAQPDYKKSPIVYGLSALYLSHGYPVKGLVAVRKRLPEIKKLGANIIWLQPITRPFEEDGHGYDVIDYENVWSELGSEKDLKDLVAAAHKLNMGVMLDVVMNHSSFKHPFVEDILKKGVKSPYYEYFQHAPVTEIPYAHHFQKRKLGKYEFIHYFWPHLLNFNYDHAPLREYLFGTLESWVKKYDIDGYRFDASWGPSTRWKPFYKTISTRLRKIKPHIILMAEDMIGYPKSYEGSGHPHLKNSGFDWAYDWDNRETDYLSKWAFQLDGDSFESTVFNIEDPEEAADAFLHALKSSQETSMLPVRYLENNDTPGSLRYHTIDQIKWAAQLIFLLPGVPLIFYGQETGNDHEMFELPSFNPATSLRTRNPKLWDFYQTLATTRTAYPILASGLMSGLKKVSPTQIELVRTHQGKKGIFKLDFKNRKAFLNGKLLFTSSPR